MIFNQLEHSNLHVQGPLNVNPMGNDTYIYHVLNRYPCISHKGDYLAFVLNISFISSFSLTCIFMQYRIIMYRERSENRCFIRKLCPSIVIKGISSIIIISASNSLNCFSLYCGTINFLLCVPLGVVIASYDSFVH